MVAAARPNAAGCGRWCPPVPELPTPWSLVVGATRVHLPRTGPARTALVGGRVLRPPLRSHLPPSASLLDRGLPRPIFRTVPTVGVVRRTCRIHRRRLRPDDPGESAARSSGVAGSRVPPAGIRPCLVARRRFPLGESGLQPTRRAVHIAGSARRGTTGRLA